MNTHRVGRRSGASHATLALVAALLFLPRIAHAAESARDTSGTVFWWGADVDPTWPGGSFDAPGDAPHIGFGAQLNIQPVRSRFGVRVEFGMVASSVHVDSVVVDYLPGFSTLQPATAGNDLWWAMIGARWGPRPLHSGVFGFATLGVLHVAPSGQVGAGPFVFDDVPGLPPISYTPAYGAGAGLRLMMSPRFALNVEAEYLHGGATDYIGSVGIEGSNPQHYASRNGPIDLFVVKLGFVARR